MYSPRSIPTGLMPFLGALALGGLLAGLGLAGVGLPAGSLISAIVQAAFGLGLVVAGAAGFACRWNRDLHSSLRALAELQSSHSDWTAPDAGSNVFRPVVEQAAHSIQPLVEEIRRAQRAQTDLELRLRMDRAEYKRIESVLNSVPDPVLVADQFGDLLLANPSAKRLLNLPADLAKRESLSQLLSPLNLADLLNETRLRSSPSRHRTEEVQVQVDGQVRWYRATASSVIDEEEQCIGTVVALDDMSRVKQVQKRYAEFVTAVSHELKTPITSIKAFAEMLVDGEATEHTTQQELFNVIDSQTDRLTRLIDNLLNLGRIEAGVAKVNKETCSLNELLEAALQVAQPAAQAKKIVLKRDLSKLHLAVHADRDMLTQAMINLLSNAVKYTPAAGEVLVRSRLTEGHAEFEVHDTGYGISAEDQERIFQKFYRVKDKTGDAPGTGLGLPLVKQIVEDVHRGSVRVRSTPGQGSCFTVAVPLAQ